MRTLLIVVSAAVSAVPAGSAREPARVVVFNSQRPAATARFRIPAGAVVERSGYLTVENAPASPAPLAAVRKPTSEHSFYAELAGVSESEAAKRLAAQRAIRPELERVVARLRAQERGNFTEIELIHRPDWAYVFYFKREPERTLARYTRNPRFQARGAPYTREELQSLAQPWIDRFAKERLFTGYGMNAQQGAADIDMIVGKEEFAAIAARNGWGSLPPYIRLKFDESPVGLAVDPAVANGIRIFPQSDRALGIIHMRGFNGSIFLRDGCFMVDQPGQKGKALLAYFPREVGLYIDPQGYLALRTRSPEPRHLGRIGETFSWAGPIGIGEDAPMVPELRRQCGSAPLMHLSVPESEAISFVRYPHLRRPVAPPPPPPAKRPSR